MLSETTGQNGGGVCNANTFITDGDIIISGNKAENDGGGVNVYNGATFTMYNGSILNNTAEVDGGGVENSGEFTMSDGKISGNTANENGGGVGNFGTAMMSGGEISLNTAIGDGGGVYTKDFFGFSNAEIYECTASNGGAVYTNENGRFETNGGSINNCYASENGGAVYIERGSDGESGLKGVATFNGTIEIANCDAGVKGGGIFSRGTIGLEKATIKNCEAAENGSGVYIDTGRLFAGGSAKVTENKKDDDLNNVFVSDNGRITIGSGKDVSTPLPDMRIGITTETTPSQASFVTFTTNGKTEDVKYFPVDDTDYKVICSNDTLCLALESAQIHTISNGTPETDKNINNGYITTSDTVAAKGMIINVSVFPNNGYQIKTIKYNDGSANYDITASKSFAMPEHEVSVFAEFEPVPVSPTRRTTTTLYTGTWGKPVSNGTWSYDIATDTWSYTTSRKFTDTWGYIANPYAGDTASWFYFDKNGRMLTGWHWVLWNGSKKCYYFNPYSDTMRGACQLGGVTPDGYTVDASGAWTVNGVVQEIK